ncbi:MAG: SpoIIE family protein phosphatase [Hyphomicrobiaceae bacterium]
MRAMFEHASRSIQGGRSYQEDSAAVWSASATTETANGGSAGELVAVLADGMGGHVGGAVASSTACETFLGAISAAAGPVTRRLDVALAEANEAIARRIHAEPRLSGMGCTLIGAIIGPQGLSWVSVGDSLLFVFRDGQLAILNEDHSLAPMLDEMVAEGKMSLEEALTDPRRHYLRSALMGSAIELVDRPENAIALEPGDIVVMATDGIETLSEEQITRTIGATASRGVEAVVSGLLDAVEGGGDPYQDNTTVIAIRVR